MDEQNQNINAQVLANQVPIQPNIQVGAQSQANSVKKVNKTKTKTLILLVGGLGFFFLFAFIFLFFVFSQTTDSASNPFIQILGINPEDWIPFLINITSVAFGFFVFIAFIVAIVGIFKIAMAKKDDKKSKVKGAIMAAVGAVLCVVLIIFWMITYLSLSAKKVAQVDASSKEYIITNPELTLDLTAPLKIDFDAIQIEKIVDKKKFQILSYEWDFGDGSSIATGQKVSHIYTEKGPNGGRYKVVLTVVFKDLKEGIEDKNIFSKDIVFSNELASTTFTISPNSGSAPLTVTFDASLSSDADGDIELYEWDFNEDGFYDDAQGVTAEHTFEKIGTYTIKLRTIDSSGQSNFAEEDLEVLPGSEPKAFITVNSDAGEFEVSQSYLFDASKSESPNDSKLVKYKWDFGDGNQANTRTANHAYKQIGDYTVILTVTDENGLTGQDTFELTVIKPKSAPTAIILPTPGFADTDETYIEGVAPFKVSFSGINSIDPDDDIVDYKWDFDGDGQYDDTGDVATYIFEDSGEYSVTLSVTDSDDNESKDSILVKVNAHGILASLSATPIQGEVPLEIDFDASGSLYPEGKIISYEWDFGDGTKRVDIAKITYTYKATGIYNATVTAVASDGTQSTATVVVSVRPVSIQACFEMSTEIGDVPLDVTFDPSCSTGTVSTYAWNFGNGKTSRDRKPEITYTKAGNYEITLQVTDKDGVTSKIKKNLVVTGELE